VIFIYIAKKDEKIEIYLPVCNIEIRLEIKKGSFVNLKELKQKEMSLIYITSRNCNVCKSIYPRLEKLMQNYGKCKMHRIETDENPEVSGEFMMFSVPGLLIFSSGMEVYRAARFIDLHDVEEVLNKYYKEIFRGVLDEN